MTMQGVVEPWWWRHVEATGQSFHVSKGRCAECQTRWPCDAERMRLRAIEAETRLARLTEAAREFRIEARHTEFCAFTVALREEADPRAAARGQCDCGFDALDDALEALSSEQEPRS